MHNSCKGVVESQAISWFAQECRHGSMLWQRLQRDMTATLAETIKIADMYALGDPTQPSLLLAEQSRGHLAQAGAGPFRRNDRQDYRNKRRDDRPDHRYGQNQVAAVDQDQQGAGSSQRQKTSGQQWGSKNDGKKQWSGEKKQWQDMPKFTFEMMLD